MKSVTTIDTTIRPAEAINPRALGRTIAIYTLLFAGWLFVQLHTA